MVQMISVNISLLLNGLKSIRLSLSVICACVIVTYLSHYDFWNTYFPTNATDLKIISTHHIEYVLFFEDFLWIILKYSISAPSKRKRKDIFSWNRVLVWRDCVKF